MSRRREDGDGEKGWMMMGKREEAVELIKNQELQHKARSGISEVAMCLLSWLRYSGEEAAERILDKEKDIVKAFNAIKEAAKKKAKDNAYNMPADEFFSEVLKYYGLSEDAASQLLEHGLMYQFLKEQQEEELEKWKPYETEAPKPQTSAPASAGLNVSLEDLL